MKAIILVGGFGTRLRPLTCNTPKAMVPVFGKPFIHYIFERLLENGISEVILAIGYLSDSIEAYFGDGSKYGMHISYVYEDNDHHLGTGGALKNAAKNVNETFLAMNGDIISDINIKEMIKFHNDKNAAFTIALHQVDNPSMYGLVETDITGRVTSFIEKPEADNITTNTINAGIYLIEPEVMKMIPDNAYCSLEHETFPQILQKDMRFYSFTDNNYWIDIGTPEKYFSIHTAMMSGTAKNNMFMNNIPYITGTDTVINDTVILKATVYLGNNVKIGKNVTFNGPVIIGNDVTIEDNVELDNVLLWNNIHIGNNVRLKNCVGANDIVFEDNITVYNSVLGDNIKILSTCQEINNQHIQPNVIVDHLEEGAL